MEPALKHRLIGAAVISALAIIFLPMLVVGGDPNAAVSKVPLKAPTAPAGDFETKELPLVTPSQAVPAGGVVGMNTSKSASPSQPAPEPPNASPAAASGVASLAVASGANPASASPANAATAGVAPIASGKLAPAAAAPAAPASVASAASPAALPAPPPIPAESAGGHYVVSLGTYSNAVNARALVSSLKAKQLPAYAEAVTMRGGPALRVRIGPFQQRGDAEAARLKAQQLRADMPANVIALDAAAPAPEPAASPAKAPPPAGTAAATAPHAVPAASGKTPVPAPSPSTDKPTPAPAAAARGFAIQVGAFGAQAQAEALRDKLRAAGFVAYSEKVHTESGERWRLRVGPVADRDGATRLQADLKAKEKLDGLVVPYP